MAKRWGTCSNLLVVVIACRVHFHLLHFCSGSNCDESNDMVFFCWWKQGWNLKWINLQSFRATFILSSIGFCLFGSQKFVNEFGHEGVWEQCFSIPSIVNAKNSNKFDYNRLVSSVPSSLSVPTTQPALIEWQNTICMPPSPPKILRQKAKRNCYSDSTRATNETPEFLSFDYWNWAWARMQTFYFFQVYFKQLFDLNTIYWL